MSRWQTAETDSGTCPDSPSSLLYISNIQFPPSRAHTSYFFPSSSSTSNFPSHCLFILMYIRCNNNNISSPLSGDARLFQARTYIYCITPIRIFHPLELFLIYYFIYFLQKFLDFHVKWQVHAQTQCVRSDCIMACVYTYIYTSTLTDGSLTNARRETQIVDAAQLRW